MNKRNHYFVMNNMEYLRRSYGLTCKRGDRVRYSPPREPERNGTIVGADWCGAYLRIRMDPITGEKPDVREYHPMWCLTYLGKGKS